VGNEHAVEGLVNTIYDLVTIGIFAGLAVLFLQRSMDPNPSNDRIQHYLPPAIGLALANWLGNQHQDLFAIVMIVCVVGYILYVLKPFHQNL
jgi:hypothetical protein